MFKEFLLLPSHSFGKLIIYEAEIVTREFLIAREINIFCHLLLSVCWMVGPSVERFFLSQREMKL